MTIFSRKSTIKPGEANSSAPFLGHSVINNLSSSEYIDIESPSSINRIPGIKQSVRTLLRRSSSFGLGPMLVSSLSTQEIPVQEPSSNIRWIVLLLSSLLLFGNFYAYDNPAALNRPLQEYLGHDYDLYQYELNLLYSVYSFPNIILPFIGGQLLDHLNPAKVLIFFSAIVCLGQIVFAWGVTIKMFPIMLLGRVLFGIGGESISVIQASITTMYFKNKELSFALGLNLCIARFGSVVNANLSPIISESSGVAAAVWVGSAFCILSFLSAVVLAFILLYKTKDRNIIISENSNNHQTYDSIWDLNELSKFPSSFWIVCCICILLYGTIVPFNNMASDFLMGKWFPGDIQKAGQMMSVPDTISALSVPICGYLVDRYGKKASVLIICSLSIALTHLLLGFTLINPIYALVILGISYSFYGATIWPAVANIIQNHEEKVTKEHNLSETPKYLGTAFGVSTSALNLTLTIMPLISARIRVEYGDYKFVEAFFILLAGLGAMMSSLLLIVDWNSGNILQRSHTENLKSNSDSCEENSLLLVNEDLESRYKPSRLKNEITQEGFKQNKDKMYQEPQEFNDY